MSGTGLKAPFTEEHVSGGQEEEKTPFCTAKSAQSQEASGRAQKSQGVAIKAAEGQEASDRIQKTQGAATKGD